MTAKGRGAFAPDGSRYITLTDGAGNLVTAEPPSGAAGGDLSGTFPNPTVAKVNGVTVTVPASGILVGTTDSQTLSNKTLTAPALGAATATTINKVALTAPATGSTLTIADGKTLTVNSTGTVAGGDAHVLAIAAGKTLTASNSGTLAGGDAFTLAIAAGKTLTASNTLTLTATDGSTLAIGTGGTLGAGAYNGYAVKSDQVAATSTVLHVNPAIQQNHPSAAKAWGVFSLSGTTYTNQASYNVASFVRNSAGNITVTLTTAFTSTRFAIQVNTINHNYNVTAFAGSASTFTVSITSLVGVATDDDFSFVCFGTQ